MKTCTLARILLRTLPPKRLSDIVIGPANDPYLLRWYIIPRNRILNIYLHNVLHSDDDRALHDHPWPSISFNITGGLSEIYCKKPKYPEDTQPNNVLKRDIPFGKWVYRGPRFAHRLYLKPETPYVGLKGIWTLFITGPRIRKWGFWCPHSWRYWKDFTKSNSSGEIGRGCD